jgi:hypothetical protein
MIMRTSILKLLSIDLIECFDFQPATLGNIFMVEGLTPLLL